MKFGPKRECDISKAHLHIKVATVQEQQSHNCRNLNFEAVLWQGSQIKCRKMQNLL